MTIPDWMCFQDLCHTFTALSLQYGDPIKTVQANLGRATAARMQQNNENMALESPPEQSA